MTARGEESTFRKGSYHDKPMAYKAYNILQNRLSFYRRTVPTCIALSPTPSPAPAPAAEAAAAEAAAAAAAAAAASTTTTTASTTASSGDIVSQLEILPVKAYSGCRFRR